MLRLVLFVMIALEYGANDLMFLPITKKMQMGHYDFLCEWSSYIKHAIMMISL